MTWHHLASCAGIPGFLDALTEREQISVCRRCPVQAECLDEGLAQPDFRDRMCTVMWGGLTPPELDAEKRRRAA